MNEPLELKDAKGYRSKYINALNDAVKQTRIVGGDAVPVETEAGTLLRIPQRGLQGRFQLFTANLYEGSSLVARCAVSDGCFFSSGQFIKLQNGKGTAYKSAGLMPRGSGWYSTLPPASWGRCEVIIFVYNGGYYLGFRYDDAELHTLIEGGSSAIEEDIQILVTIGEFSATEDRIIQYVSSDIYYGGAGEAPPVAVEREPWEVFSTEEAGALVWWIAHPKWTLSAPYAIYPEGANPPQPEEAYPWTALFPAASAVEIDGILCWRVGNLIPPALMEGGTRLFANLDYYGNLRLAAAPDACVGFLETPAYILLGQFNADFTAFAQVRKGEIYSVWEETPAFFVEGGCSSADTRHAAAPVGLSEGTQMVQMSYWILATYINETLVARAENLGHGPAMQQALLYGNYIWRYNLHYRASDNTLIRDAQTTAVLNVAANIFASVIETPYVERINVVYPETPLDQGSVDAVGGKINVLAVGAVEDTSVTLFKTESVSTTEGGLIEVTQ